MATTQDRDGQFLGARVVRIDDGKRPLGTGVLVGRLAVLTAAHVVAGVEPSRLLVRPLTGGHPMAVKAAALHPEKGGDPYPLPDLAMLELSSPVDVWCGIADEPEAGAILRCMALTRDSYADGSTATTDRGVTVLGHTIIDDHSTRLLELRTHVLKGMSGAPLFDKQLRVAGIVKRTRDLRLGTGGWATPPSAIVATFPELTVSSGDASLAAYRASHLTGRVDVPPGLLAGAIVAPPAAEAVVEILRRPRSDGGNGRTVALWGTTGVGKSTAAAVAAVEVSSDYSGVIWLSVGPDARAEDDATWVVKPLATRSGAGAGSPAEIRAALAATGPWLVVCDDVWRTAVMQSVVRHLPLGTDVLVTARDRGVADWLTVGHSGQVVEVVGVDRDGAQVLAAERQLSLPNSLLHDLIEVLDGNPQALDVALATLARRPADRRKEAVQLICERVRAGVGVGEPASIHVHEGAERLRRSLLVTDAELGRHGSARRMFHRLAVVAADAYLGRSCIESLCPGVDVDDLMAFLADFALVRQVQTWWEMHQLVRSTALQELRTQADEFAAAASTYAHWVLESHELEARHLIAAGGALFEVDVALGRRYLEDLSSSIVSETEDSGIGDLRLAGLFQLLRHEDVDRTTRSKAFRTVARTSDYFWIEPKHWKLDQHRFAATGDEAESSVVGELAEWLRARPEEGTALFVDCVGDTTPVVTSPFGSETVRSVASAAAFMVGTTDLARGLELASTALSTVGGDWQVDRIVRELAGSDPDAIALASRQLATSDRDEDRYLSLVIASEASFVRRQILPVVARNGGRWSAEAWADILGFASEFDDDGLLREAVRWVEGEPELPQPWMVSAVAFIDPPCGIRLAERELADREGDDLDDMLRTFLNPRGLDELPEVRRTLRSMALGAIRDRNSSMKRLGVAIEEVVGSAGDDGDRDFVEAIIGEVLRRNECIDNVAYGAARLLGGAQRNSDLARWVIQRIVASEPSSGVVVALEALSAGPELFVEALDAVPADLVEAIVIGVLRRFSRSTQSVVPLVAAFDAAGIQPGAARIIGAYLSEFERLSLAASDQGSGRFNRRPALEAAVAALKQPE